MALECKPKFKTSDNLLSTLFSDLLVVVRNLLTEWFINKDRVIEMRSLKGYKNGGGC